MSAPLSPHFSTSLDEPFLLWGEIDAPITALLARHLRRALGQVSPKQTTIMVCSDGGDGDYARGIVGLLEMVKGEGVEVRMVGVGLVGSAALDVFIAGTPGQRYAADTTFFLVHATSSNTNNRREQELANSYDALQLDRYSAIPKITRNKFLATGDWYLNAKEAADYGLVDHVLPPNTPLILPPRPTSPQEGEE